MLGIFQPSDHQSASSIKIYYDFDQTTIQGYYTTVSRQPTSQDNMIDIDSLSMTNALPLVTVTIGEYNMKSVHYKSMDAYLCIMHSEL